MLADALRRREPGRRGITVKELLMTLLFILLFASFITSCVVAVKKMIKEREFNVLTCTSVLNVVLFVIIIPDTVRVRRR